MKQMTGGRGGWDNRLMHRRVGDEVTRRHTEDNKIAKWGVGIVD